VNGDRIHESRIEKVAGYGESSNVHAQLGGKAREGVERRRICFGGHVVDS
jgi:hypothetical protein